jgi:hypothetical protein
MSLARLVVALVDCAVEHRSVRVNTWGMRPEAMFAFHMFRARWWVTAGVNWIPASDVN